MKQILIYWTAFLFIMVMPALGSAQSLTWHADALMPGIDYDASIPHVAMSGSNAVAVWKQNTSGQDRIYASYSTDKGATWTLVSHAIDFSTLSAQEPQVAIDGSNAVVVFRQWDSARNRIYANYSTNGGATWAGAQLIENNTGNNGYEPQVVISGSHVVAIWKQLDGTRDRIYANHSINGGATWGTDVIIDSRAYAASQPHLAMSGNNVVALWSQQDGGGSSNIYSRYSNDGGVTWAGTDDQLIENIDGLGNYPRIAISGTNVAAIWVTYDTGEGLSHVYTNRAAFSGSSGGTLTWTAGNAQRLDNSYPMDAGDPRIAISGNRLVAAWSGYEDGTSAYRVYTSYSADAGVTWGTDRLLQSDNTVDAGGPTIAISGSNAVAVWSQEDASGDNRIYARHSFNGGSSWSTPGLIENNAGFGAHSAIVAVSGDNVVAAWNQLDASYGRIYSNYAAFGPAVITDLGTGGGCFIATTAFGTPLAVQVEVLRQFRDRYLLSNSLGRQFVAWYYKNGPTAAGFIQDKPLLKAAVRASLYPLIGFSFLLINGFMPLVMIGLLLSIILFFRFRQKKLDAR